MVLHGGAGVHPEAVLDDVRCEVGIAAGWRACAQDTDTGGVEQHVSGEDEEDECLRTAERL
eukprot:2848987-Pyramimonas_sp.AAC.1